MPFHTSIFFFLQILNVCLADHYKGGTISWKPVNPYALVNPVPIIITERHSWTLSRYQCNQTTINTFSVINDTASTIPATLTCISSSAVCTASLFQTINSPLVCTDFSIGFSVSTGVYTSSQSLAQNSVIDIAWRGAAWATQTLTNEWSLVAHINLTTISGNKINSSPITCSVPVIRLYVNQATNIQILAADWDSDQVVRCRWSYQLPTDECGNVCYNLPSAIIKPQDCTINWTAVLRPQDIANGLTESIYVIAITAEDFDDDTTTTPYSSIPHQAIVHVFTPTSPICPTLPQIVSAPRRNQACFGVNIGATPTYNFYGRVYCAGDSIVDFITSSPLYMIRQNITQTANDTWLLSFKYTVLANQTGIQPFCITAIDNHGVSSAQYCISIVVNATSTIFATPILVQGTASPVGTVMSTQRRFSIQANVAVKRPVRDGSQIRIYIVNNVSLIWYIDTKTSPDVFYSNRTITFFVRNYVWTLGETYCVVLLEGVATADQYCGLESPTYSGTTFWRFTIWDPQMSSTTTPSTTTSTATTHTVTTRSMGTTTANTLFTTTGIPAYTTFTTTTTTATTSTTVTTTTTTSETTTTTTTTTTTAYIPDAVVMYPKDMEEACVQPVTIATALITAAAIPLHLYAMITLFVKMNAQFQQEALKLRNARHIRLEKPLINNEEKRRFV